MAREESYSDKKCNTQGMKETALKKQETFAKADKSITNPISIT